MIRGRDIYLFRSPLGNSDAGGLKTGILGHGSFQPHLSLFLMAAFTHALGQSVPALCPHCSALLICLLVILEASIGPLLICAAYFMATPILRFLSLSSFLVFSPTARDQLYHYSMCDPGEIT